MSDRGRNSQAVELDEFELRADYVNEEDLLAETATNDFYEDVHKTLVSKNLSLIVGPRGCGKTHMMRYTWLKCQQDESLPLAVYVTFNRYYRLEPLLKSKANAISVFHSWVLARIIESINDTVARFEKPTAGSGLSLDALNEKVADITGYEVDEIKQLVSMLERGSHLSESAKDLVNELSIETAVELLTAISARYRRRRSVLLLDDAALLLTPEYLSEFFDIVRSLKRVTIAPKASVYPGTTEYGPRFHAQHEAASKDVWLSTDDESYSATMQAVAELRYPDGLQNLAPAVNELFKIAAFGIPRAYLTLLRDYQSESGNSRQQSINKIIDKHHDGRLQEYRSLIPKMPKLETLIKTGESFFLSALHAVEDANTELLQAEKQEKQTVIGIYEQDISPIVDRMINLLVEAGLIYKLTSVSHGVGRQHRRYIPHMASLMAVRAFSGKGRGSSPKQIVEYLSERKLTKHAVRRKLVNWLSPDEVDNLGLDLPPCQNCSTARLNDNQKFCHNCGAKLFEFSTYHRCMSIPLSDVPGITPYQKSQLKRAQSPAPRTIGDLLSTQDPGTELRRIPWVGDVRARRMQSLVVQYVEEFLS